MCLSTENRAAGMNEQRLQRSQDENSYHSDRQ
jgi:hypothetical protein